MEVLPGDTINPEDLPKSSKKQLRLGPGLVYSPPSSITTAVAGELQTDPKKNAIWIESFSKGGRYIPRPNDLVIGQVHHSAGEFFHVALSSGSPFAILPHLAFDSVTKKTRPNLAAGDLVYARVSSGPTKYLDATELECLTVSPTSGASDAGLGPLKGGSACDVSLDFARRLMMGAKKGGVGVLQALGDKYRFEVAVGRNGRVWIQAQEIPLVIKAIEALKTTDKEDLNEDEQKKLVTKLIKELENMNKAE